MAADRINSGDFQAAVSTFGEAPGADDGWRIVKIGPKPGAWWRMKAGDPKGKYDLEAEGWLRQPEP